MPTPARRFDVRPIAAAFPCGRRFAALSIAILAFFACPSSNARAETVSIDGGASWTGWTVTGVSDKGYTQGTLLEPGIWATSNTAANQYRVRSTSFVFDSTKHFKTGVTTGSQVGSGSTGFGSGTFTISGSNYTSFANGNKILGVGVELLSGSLVPALTNFNTIRFDLQGGSYAAAPTFGGTGGLASFSSRSHTADYTVQFLLAATTGAQSFTVYSMNSQAGNPISGTSADLTRTLDTPTFLNSTVLPFRVFANGTFGSSFTSYQMLFDMTAAYQLFGPKVSGTDTWGDAQNFGTVRTGGTTGVPWQPIGQAGTDVNFSINGFNGASNTAFGAVIVPEPSLPAIAAVSLLALGAGRLIARRMRSSPR